MILTLFQKIICQVRRKLAQMIMGQKIMETTEIVIRKERTIQMTTNIINLLHILNKTILGQKIQDQISLKCMMNIHHMNIQEKKQVHFA